VHGVIEALRRLVEGPVFEDEEKTRTAGLLKLILLTLLALAFIISLMAPFSYQNFKPLLAVNLMIGIGLIAGLYALQHGLVYKVAWVFVSLLWLFFTYVTVQAGGVASLAVISYFAVVMIAWLVLGGKAGILFACLSTVATLGITVAEVNQLLPPATLTGTAFSRWVILAANFTILAVLMHLANQDLRKSFDRSRQNERALAQSNLELEKEIAERQRYESALIVSEERYRLLSNIISDYTFSSSVGEKGELTPEWVGGAFERITGYSFEEYNAAGGWRATLHPDDLAVDEQDFKKLQTNQPVISEVRTITKAGEQRIVRVYAHPVWSDQENRLTGIYGAVQDITERKQAELALFENQEQYRSILANIDEIVYLVNYQDGLNYQGKVAFVSERVKHILGYQPHEFIEEPGLWFSLIHPDDVQKMQEQTETIFANRQPALREYRLRHKETGEYSFIEDHVVPQLNAAGEVIATFGVARDVTKRKQRERELEAVASLGSVLRAALTRSEMIPAILDQLMKLIPIDSAALALRDPVKGDVIIEQATGNFSLASGIRLPGGQGVVGEVINSGLSYISSESIPHPFGFGLFREARALAVVPLILQARPMGALMVGSFTESSNRQLTFDESEIRLLRAVADFAAAALHRAALYEQTERRMHHLGALRDIDAAITASLDLQITLNVLLGKVISQPGVDAAGVFLLNPHLNILEFAAGRGFRTQKAEHTHLLLGQTFAGKVALERRTIYVSSAGVSSAPKFAELWAEEGFVAYHGVPFIAKAEVKGVLEVFYRSPISQDAEWTNFLEMIAAQAAIAIDNAQLFDRLEHANLDLTMAYDATIEGWSRALELRDRETEGHTLRVTEMAEQLARAMGLGDNELVHIHRGSLLHDIGKMAVPDSILLNPGKLTEEEMAIMRRHPQHAYDMLSHISYLRPSLDIPLYHHERWDGTGYPHGLKGEQIPLAARIFAVVDVWDALSYGRIYRPAWPKEEVRQYIMDMAGSLFDPQIVNVFIDILESPESKG
jgi:PAS domain S-box-containing protein